MSTRPAHESGHPAVLPTLLRESVASDPVGFWIEATGGVSWFRKPRPVVVDGDQPLAQWFTDGTLNACYNALDLHVINGAAERTALVWASASASEGDSDSADAEPRREVSYGDLLGQVGAFAGALQQLGVEKGDRIMALLPLQQESVVAMLAASRLGAVYVSTEHLSDTAQEWATTIAATTPAVIVTGAKKVLVDEALALADHVPGAVIVVPGDAAELPMDEVRDLDWEMAMRAGYTQPGGCADVEAAEPMLLLASGGRSTGAHCVGTGWVMRRLLGVGPGEMFNGGRVWVEPAIAPHALFGPLSAGATIVLPAEPGAEIEELAQEAPQVAHSVDLFTQWTPSA